MRVVNSGVSGDTAANGLARLDWSLNEKVDGVIVEFGANDALRGIDPKVTEPSLDEILKTLKEKHIELLVAGIEAPATGGTATTMPSGRCIPGLQPNMTRCFIHSF